ncbi:hypothetical protein EUX98_g386 [Antrodiella citrinella]|uniref:F-box domain-containing protein n=1 Tax=Antrodiella citrinella TaxID=2447956 RepID=A0A4S4NCN8_9APHY|nr:hypothetical protein EUX98_g386 [Antrodiella citrinella]
MSFASLPPELLDAIFLPLSTNALLAVATACSAFTASADRHLYRHLALSSHASNISAVHTLAAQKNLASLVRTFSLDADPYAPDAVSQHFHVALHQALAHMEGLTSLELNIRINESWLLKDLSCGNSPTTYPHLQHFASSIIFDQNTVSFLLRAPSILSLQLSSSVAPSDIVALELPTDAIPKLTTYTGPASLLRHLSPRPLTTLLLSDDLKLDDVQYLSPSLRAPRPSPNVDVTSASPPTDVQVLSAITSAPPVLIMEALAKACPHLSCLRVMTTCAFWEAPDLSFYTHIAQTLSTLPALTAFELSGMHWESRPKSPASGLLEFGEKEWVSPPVTPRVADMDFQQDPQDHDFGISEAFLDWSV